MTIWRRLPALLELMRATTCNESFYVVFAISQIENLKKSLVAAS
jgi:hypothetical protein